MAKGGSGDVLAGIIASLTAQGADPINAAAAGVHIHALAGDLAAERLGKTSMLPSDIIEALPDIFILLENKEQ
jgi:NAD(P)H-hydrate epimerase